jgi:hypothetical protein
LQQQEQNVDADATSIVGTNVEEQLQASSSNFPSKLGPIALFSLIDNYKANYKIKQWSNQN